MIERMSGTPQPRTEYSPNPQEQLPSLEGARNEPQEEVEDTPVETLVSQEPMPHQVPLPAEPASHQETIHPAPQPVNEASSFSQSSGSYANAWTEARHTIRGQRGGRILYTAAVAGGIVGIAAATALFFVIGGLAGLWWASGKFTSFLGKIFTSDTKKKHEKKKEHADHKNDHKGHDHGGGHKHH